MDENEKQKNYAPTLKAFYGIVAILCIILNVCGIGRSGTEEGSTEEEQEQSGEKNKQTKRGGFGHAARRRSSWGTG